MEFKFASTERNLVINGLEFTMRVGDVETIERVERVQEESKSLMAESGGGSLEPKTAAEVRKACLILGKHIDGFLGDGAYERIFCGRPLNFLEHVELVNHLFEEMQRLTVSRRKVLLGANAAPEIAPAPKPDGAGKRDGAAKGGGKAKKVDLPVPTTVIDAAIDDSVH